MKPRRFFFHQPQVFGMPLRCGVPIALGFMVFFTGLDADAGDILRGGSGQGGAGKARGGNLGGAPPPSATDAARANARDTLARTTKTLASIRAMQNAARNAAKTGPNSLGRNPLKPTIDLPKVPNGLITGGLKVSGAVTTDPSKWKGAKLPTQTVKNGKTTVTIKQTEQQALLEWETFNVGKNTTVNFDQKKGGENAGQWIAFNKVNDPSANPTQILGNIKADGQVYLINPNGVIFGGSSQVNARGLTVSSLPINTNLIDRGLLNNPDAQFLFSGLDIPAGVNGTPAFTPEKPLDPSGNYGDVIVEKGAILKSPTNSAKVGGRITLVGPNVINNGSILTPDGQTILAAGLQVGFAAHSASDPSLRGLDVFVGKVEDPLAGRHAGKVLNTGLIEAQRGAITVGGAEIIQNGVLYSTTSVSFNGRVDLSSNFDAVSNRTSTSSRGDLFLYQKSGSVSLGEKSLIAIVPEYGSKETTIGTELALKSQVLLTGRTIHAGIDSLIFAPNGDASLSAGRWFFDTTSAQPKSTFVANGGQIYIDKGAGIDVAGSLNVPVPVSQNIIEVDLRGAELADSPLQRDGSLRNQTIYVDIRNSGVYEGKAWLGTPLANVSGFANLIQRGVGQLTTAGGNVTLSAGGSVVLRDGSTIDVSGGSTFFEGGMVRTTRLNTGGRLVDISQASAEVVYDGIFDGTFTAANPKFGVSKTYWSMLAPAGFRFEGSSVSGASGGKLNISAPSMAVDGTLSGHTVIGDNQRVKPPTAASLSLSFTAIDTTYPTLPVHAPTPPTVTFARKGHQTAPDAFTIDSAGEPSLLPEERRKNVYLDPDILIDGGFGSLDINNRGGDIVIPEASTLRVSDGGHIGLGASNITINGSVIARSGSLSFSTFGLTYDTLNQIQNSPPAGSPPTIPADKGIFSLGSKARLDVSGLVVDDRRSAGGAIVSPVLLSAGSVSISGYSALTAKGGLIDVSGGAAVDGRGAVSYGNGGSLSISAGFEPGFSAAIGGRIELNAEMNGLSGAKASSLKLTAPALLIGGKSGIPGATRINPESFTRSGFGTLTISGIGIPEATASPAVAGVTVAEGADVNMRVSSLLGTVNSDGYFVLERITRQEGRRQAVNLTLSSPGASFAGRPIVIGSVVTETGSRLATDAGGTVNINSQTITLAGSIITPGGEINIIGNNSFPTVDLAEKAGITVYIEKSAVLDAAGTTVLLSDPFGRRTGTVHHGGNITVSGNVFAESGALIDVSGTSAVLDLPAGSGSLGKASSASLGGTRFEPVRISSDGGEISIKGSEILFSGATLLGNAGGESATGGVLSVSSGRFLKNGQTYTTADTNLVVTQSPETFRTPQGVGDPVLGSDGNIAEQLGHFSLSSMRDGGFDSLYLKGNVRFDGNATVRLPGRVVVADGGVVRTTGSTLIEAGYVMLGQAFRAPTLNNDPILFSTGTFGLPDERRYFLNPEHGSGRLTVRSNTLDVGVISLNGIGNAVLDASKGDLRGNGTLQMAGNLVIRAGQIYAPTKSQFGVFVYDFNQGGAPVAGSIMIDKGIRRDIPLSAGGTLSIHATSIDHRGTIRMPLGTVNLGWDGTTNRPFNPITGSGFAVPVTTNLDIRSGSTTSVSAISPLSGKPVAIPYGISPDGESWIDPAGNNITLGGSPEKRINLSASALETEDGAVIDVRGGGNIKAYRWVAGNGGTLDVLATDSSFAIIPGYAFDYAPYAPFNPDSSAEALGGDPGYVNSKLRPGDQITINGGRHLPAGTYTLLPARYALLKGAMLVTLVPGNPGKSTVTPEGTSVVAGYIANNLDQGRTGATRVERFEIIPGEIVRTRSTYEDFLGNKMLLEAAATAGATVPRLPVDSGFLTFTANTSMKLSARVESSPGNGGRGALVDINSSASILINRSGSGSAPGQLVLRNSEINSLGTESLLIGGLRSQTSGGLSLATNASSVILDNKGDELRGKDIILAGRNSVTVSSGSAITADTTGNAKFEKLILGSSLTPGSGEGSLVRVNAGGNPGIVRNGLTGIPSVGLRIGSNARLEGGAVTIDSSDDAFLSDLARIRCRELNLGAGRISIKLNNSGSLGASPGLVLSGATLGTIRNSTSRLVLNSYSSLDTYGQGVIGGSKLDLLSIRAGAINGYNAGTGVRFNAASINLGNDLGANPGSFVGAETGVIRFEADQINLRPGELRLNGFGETELSSSGSISTSGAGALVAGSGLILRSAVLTGSSASNFRIAAGGLLSVVSQRGAADVSPDGLGARLALEGDSITINGSISLSSGRLEATAGKGDIRIGNAASTLIDLSGTTRRILDVERSTNGGTAVLEALQGSVQISALGTIDVSGPAKGGSAGLISISVPDGQAGILGSIKGTAANASESGSFMLDASGLTGGSLASLDSILNDGGFRVMRSFRIRTGDVVLEGVAQAADYRLSVDGGDLSVSGTVDASGRTGGSIRLASRGSLTLDPGAILDASGVTFNSAGKGGSVTLEAGSPVSGVSDPGAVLNLATGSTINLGITARTAASEANGNFTGTLHLRAPRNLANSDVAVAAIGSSINGASSVLIEGVKLYEVAGAGVISSAVQNLVRSDAVAFMGSAGSTTSGYTTMLNRLRSLHPGLDLVVAPGAEIFNPGGDLVLGSTTSTATADWNLQTFRFGPLSAPGVLTLRAAGDLVFYNALSDGFSAVTPNADNGQSSLWLAPLMARNGLLPANLQSWSYRLTSGADFSSADYRSVLDDSVLASGKGSLLLGKNYGNAATFGSGANHTTARSISGRFQVIRTGTGDISIHSGRNVYLLNQFASIYTAGSLLPEPTTVLGKNDFVLPVFLNEDGRHPSQGSLLGAVQQSYFAQYSMAGGNITISAGQDVARMTRNTNSPAGGSLIPDSTRQMPNNWLYRRGHVDPASGKSGPAGTEELGLVLNDPDASVTWWVDFSNFFEGIGTLGGGNILLMADRNVSNIDAAAPTNARMAGGKPSASRMVELGGGDVTVSAGADIDGGVFYVERGSGRLTAGAGITTNQTRSPSRGILASLTNPQIFDSNTWLPTTLFAGKADFRVEAADDILLGPVSNPFWLPQGLNNKHWYKTYFSTYSPQTAVEVVSLGGDITHRSRVSLPTEISSRPVLGAWFLAHQSLSTANGAASFQPWLRTAETNSTPFSTLFSVTVPSISSSALSGSIKLAGSMTLSPAAKGQLEFVASDSITGLQPTGLVTSLGVQRWLTASVNLSDADPRAVPGIENPLSYLQVVGRANSAQRLTGSGTGAGFLDSINGLFSESGATGSPLEEKQARHTPGGLHAADNQPTRLYALNGSIDGIELFSPKRSRVIAGTDIGDVSLYIQNLKRTDISLVSAGRDLIPFNASSASRTLALQDVSANPSVTITALAGDIQISGPGTLEVLAGRDLNLGLGDSLANGLGSGITSIGNARNPYLGFEGASIIVGAGIGSADSLSGSNADFESFIDEFVLTESGRKILKEIAPGTKFESLSREDQAIIALEVFYRTLRDSGRAFNNPKSPDYRDPTYPNGFNAIKTLFPESFTWEGDILTQSRDIRTKSGGDISIFAPGGGLIMADTTIGNPLAPPGVVTESGGDVSIFTDHSVDIGIGRIFTLKGGDISIWSSKGDIAAGSSSRTVSAAPPTRVIVDPQSAAVETDLAGLATGGGIGVLATVAGVAPGDVDLIAPSGIIDAGDAGIRVSGNINLAAVTVVNSANISAGGTSTGAPSTSVSAPSISTVTSASNATVAAGSTMTKPTDARPEDTGRMDEQDETPSLYVVEVIGYGGGAAPEDDEDDQDTGKERGSDEPSSEP